MIVFREKSYSKPISWHVKRKLAIPALQGMGMPKKQAIKTVAKTSVKGVSEGSKEFTPFLKEEPGAVIGGAFGTFSPVPGGTILGAQLGREVQHGSVLAYNGMKKAIKV